MPSDSDIGRHIEAAAKAIFGNHNARLSKKNDLRFGSNGSFSVDPSKGQWYDHEAKEGGGVLDLLKREKGLAGVEAVDWLRSIGCAIEDRRGAQGGQRRRSDDTPPWDDAPPPPAGLDDYGRGGASPGGAPEPNDPAQEALRKGPTRVYAYEDMSGELVLEVCRYEWMDQGKKHKTFRQRRPPGPKDKPKSIRGGYVWSLNGISLVPYGLPRLANAIANGETICVCYTPDTQVLTPAGWIGIADVAGATVAQWDQATGGISFARVIGAQQFEFDGDLVSIKSRFSDLLVTPDHRQPVYMKDGSGTERPSVRLAKDLPQQSVIPVSGIKQGNASVGNIQTRLYASWLADGVAERRGLQASWNLKKRRKVERLRGLLDALGIAFKTYNYPSCPEWTSFRVARADLDAAMQRPANKLLGWDSLDWSLADRLAFLDELQFWDGDHGSARHGRFFTGKESEADIISAMGALSGFSAVVRRDKREAKNTSFVLNLTRADRRIVAHAPGRVPYRGKVYCCTVPTGFLVVRRNGRVVISGNCEGEKDVETLWDWGIAATCNPQGSGKWPDEFDQYFQNAKKVILLEDNDEAGRHHVAVVGAAMRRIGVPVSVVDFREMPPKSDVTDWAETGKTEDDFFEKIERAKLWKPEVPKSAYGAVRFIELEEPAPDIEWLWDEFLTCGDKSIIGGASQSGKSFLGINLGLHIAGGTPFLGRETMQGLVCYQAGESARGARRRMKAFRIEHGVAADLDLPFVLLSKRIDLFSKDSGDVQGLIDEVKAWQAYYVDYPLRWLCIDTLARAAVGAEENSAKDMGIVLDNMDRLENALGCAVSAVHHMNAIGSKLRGSSAVYANVEQVLAISRDPETNVRTIRVDKMKDEADGGTQNFELKVHELGIDKRGKKITSCVVMPAGWKDGRAGEQAPEAHDQTQAKRFRLRKNETAPFLAILAAIRDHGESAPPEIAEKYGLPPERRVVRWPFVLEAFEKSTDETDPERIAKLLGDVGTSLRKFRVIERENPFIWWTGKPVEGFAETYPPRSAQSRKTDDAKSAVDEPMVDEYF